MINDTIVQAMQVGGNAGLLLMGVALMRLQIRVARLEIAQELRQEMKKNG